MAARGPVATATAQQGLASAIALTNKQDQQANKQDRQLLDAMDHMMM